MANSAEMIAVVSNNLTFLVNAPKKTAVKRLPEDTLVALYNEVINHPDYEASTATDVAPTVESFVPAPTITPSAEIFQMQAETQKGTMMLDCIRATFSSFKPETTRYSKREGKNVIVPAHLSFQAGNAYITLSLDKEGVYKEAFSPALNGLIFVKGAEFIFHAPKDKDINISGTAMYFNIGLIESLNPTLGMLREHVATKNIQYSLASEKARENMAVEEAQDIKASIKASASSLADKLKALQNPAQ